MGPDFVRRQPVQAILVAKWADSLEAGTAIQIKTDNVRFIGEWWRKSWRGRTINSCHRDTNSRRNVHQPRVIADDMSTQ